MKEEKQTPALVMGSQLNTHSRRNLKGNIARMSRMLPSNGAFRCPARWPRPLFGIIILSFQRARCQRKACLLDPWDCTSCLFGGFSRC